MPETIHRKHESEGVIKPLTIREIPEIVQRGRTMVEIPELFVRKAVLEKLDREGALLRTPHIYDCCLTPDMASLPGAEKPQIYQLQIEHPESQVRYSGQPFVFDRGPDDNPDAAA